MAENSRHRVVRYDRDGKSSAAFGKRDRDGVGAGFGGCCNPMNLCFDSAGDLLVAESDGKVKHFTPAGKYVGLVGVARRQTGLQETPPLPPAPTAIRFTTSTCKNRRSWCWLATRSCRSRLSEFDRPRAGGRQRCGIILCGNSELVFVALAIASSLAARATTDENQTDAKVRPFTLVVMDPLAKPLSCPCVKGYAQRDYEKLSQKLQTLLDRPVKIVFNESLTAGSKVRRRVTPTW